MKNETERSNKNNNIVQENVNYPLLQAEDDDTYMNTDAEGKYSLSGSIFLHCANKPDFSDFNNMDTIWKNT